jgi:hypothetical protein
MAALNSSTKPPESSPCPRIGLDGVLRRAWIGGLLLVLLLTMRCVSVARNKRLLAPLFLFRHGQYYPRTLDPVRLSEAEVQSVPEAPVLVSGEEIG